jgi:acyl carrier protein
MNNDLRLAVRKFVSDNFLFRDDLQAIADDTSFLDAGIIDSTGVLELVCFLEGSYGVEVSDQEMLPENFDSIARIAAYLQRKLEAGRAPLDAPPVAIPAMAAAYAG